MKVSTISLELKNLMIFLRNPSLIPHFRISKAVMFARLATTYSIVIRLRDKFSRFVTSGSPRTLFIVKVHNIQLSLISSQETKQGQTFNQLVIEAVSKMIYKRRNLNSIMITLFSLMRPSEDRNSKRLFLI